MHVTQTTLTRLKAQPGFRYERHKPEASDLYQVIERYWPAFQDQLTEAGVSLPGFIHTEFQSYLKCGLLKHGYPVTD